MKVGLDMRFFRGPSSIFYCGLILLESKPYRSGKWYEIRSTEKKDGTCTVIEFWTRLESCEAEDPTFHLVDEAIRNVPLIFKISDQYSIHTSRASLLGLVSSHPRRHILECSLTVSQLALPQ